MDVRMRRNARRVPPLLMAALLAAAALGGCAGLLNQRGGPDPDAVLARGLAALDRGEYKGSHEDLTWVYINYPDRPVGLRALIALAAAEMDPRNPRQRLNVGTQLLERIFDKGTLPPWEEPLTETLYLLGLDLGAKDYALVRAQAAADSAQKLEQSGGTTGNRPRLPRQPVAAELRSLRAERDQLRDSTARLETRAAQLQSQLQDAHKELERIRKTLHG